MKCQVLYSGKNKKKKKFKMSSAEIFTQHAKQTNDVLDNQMAPFKF